MLSFFHASLYFPSKNFILHFTTVLNHFYIEQKPTYSFIYPHYFNLTPTPSKMTSWFKNLFHHKDKQPQQDKTQQKLNYGIFSRYKNLSKSPIQQDKHFGQKQGKQQNSDQRDSDEDSLGYTENQWDQETINFQLEDRMLDCLEEEKYANSYRQSLSLALSLARKSSKKITRQPLASNQNNQIPIEAIINQQFTDSQSDSKRLNSQDTASKSKSSTNQANKNDQNALNSDEVREPKQQLQAKTQKKPKKNRFSKYMKKGQNNLKCEEPSWVGYLSPQLEKKIDAVARKKAEEISIEQKESSEDYINRVLNLKIGSEDLLNEKTKQQQGEANKGQKSQQAKQMQRKQSAISSTSFAVYDEKSPDLHSIEISRISQNNYNGLNFNESDQFPPNINEGSTQDNGKELPITSESFNQAQKLQLLDSQPQKKSQTQKMPVPIIQNPSHKQSPKPYHILTPPKPKSSENLAKKNQEALNDLIPSDKSIPQNKNPFEKPKIIQNLSLPLKIHFISSSEAIPQFSSPDHTAIPKSPRAKVTFNYGAPQQTNLLKIPSFSTTPIYISPLTRPHQSETKKRPQMHYVDPQPEQRFPIFLRRLRRINSCYPNLFIKQICCQKVNSDWKSLLKAMQSAISVLELLYKKLCIQKSKLNEPFAKIRQITSLTEKQIDYKRLLERQIMDFFLNSQWQNSKIEQIVYIKPNQRFQKRKFEPNKFEQAIDTYNKFIDHYLKEADLQLKSQQEIKRYYRIREKASAIVQYLRIISEDLYTFWLIQCNYPELYHDFLYFLRLSKNPNPVQYRETCDQIYAKLLFAEQYKDPLSLSVVGRRVLEKIQAANLSQ